MNVEWTREESKERFPYPISPLGWSVLRTPTEVSLQALTEYLGFKKPRYEEIVKNINGYIYTRKHFFQNRLVGKIKITTVIEFAFLVIKAGIHVTFANLSDSKAPLQYRIPGLQWLFGLPGFLNKERLYSCRETYNPFVKAINYLVINKFLNSTEMILQEWRHQKTSVIAAMHEKINFPQSLTVTEFIRIKGLLQSRSGLFFQHDFNAYFLKNVIYQWLQFQLKVAGFSLKKAQDYLNEAVLGLQGNFSVQAAVAFKTMPKSEWLSKYGHLTDNWDIMAPLLSELPADFIHETMACKNLPQSGNRFASLNPAPGLLGAEFAQALQRFQELVIMDEELRAHSSAQYPEIKKLMKKITEQVYWPSALATKDIYFMTLDEIEMAIELRSFQTFADLIRQRRTNYEKALLIEPPLEWPAADSQALRPSASNKLHHFSGTPISNGTVLGQALLIRSIDDFANYVPDKYILVVRAANPTYAPYYTSCLGIISERGGLLSHGALVARELGLPMVGEIDNLFLNIKSGDFLRLDGNLGTVEILEKADKAEANQTTPLIKVMPDEEHIRKQSARAP